MGLFGLNMAEPLPQHRAIFKSGGGECQRWHLRWQQCILHPEGNFSMVRAQRDLANENERGNQQLSRGRMWGQSYCLRNCLHLCMWQFLHVLVCIRTVGMAVYTWESDIRPNKWYFRDMNTKTFLCVGTNKKRRSIRISYPQINYFLIIWLKHMHHWYTNERYMLNTRSKSIQVNKTWKFGCWQRNPQLNLVKTTVIFNAMRT